MNIDIAEGKWTQVKGKLRENWGDLTDDEIGWSPAGAIWPGKRSGRKGS